MIVTASQLSVFIVGVALEVIVVTRGVIRLFRWRLYDYHARLNDNDRQPHRATEADLIAISVGAPPDARLWTERLSLRLAD